MRRVAWGLALLLCWADAATAEGPIFQGRRLDEALQLLQRQGLSIIFSSEIVTPAMRVAAEPRSATLRGKLNELLAPHGLKAEAGPGQTILIVREGPPSARPSRQPLPSSVPQTRLALSPPTPPLVPTTYSDRVIVRASDEDIQQRPSEISIAASVLRAVSSAVGSEGLDAVRAMPGVAAGDDFRTDFSVRGSPYRQIGIVIDGVPATWLQHTVYGRKGAGSLSIFGSGILDRAALQAGAYPRRYEDVLGAQLDLTVREGSRDRSRFAGTAGSMSAGFAGEGPIGSEGRGSWMAGLRNSNRAWPPGPSPMRDAGFSFADVHGKLVYDLTPAQHVSVTALGGRSALDTMDEPFDGASGAGTDRAGLLTVGWRSALGSQTVVRQRLFFVGQDLAMTAAPGALPWRGSNRALGYRGETLRSIFGGVLDGGVELSDLSGSRHVDPAGVATWGDAFHAAWTTRALFVNFARSTSGGGSFEIGARASDSTLVRPRVISPWVRAARRIAPGWIINASAGTSQQFPGVDAVAGLGSGILVPEHAIHVDVGVERSASRFQWQATLFNRIENHVLRGPDPEPRLVQGVVFQPDGAGRYRNALRGASHGLDLVVTPRGTRRLSGWVSYTYAATRQTDTIARETYWGDFDRRHTFNATGVLDVGHHALVGLVVRAASGAPLSGYFEVKNGALFVGERRNEVRLPPYVRLDARLQRTFVASDRAVTVFGEILNALNRRNQGIAQGLVEPATGQAVGFTQPLLPRRVFFGIEVALSR